MKMENEVAAPVGGVVESVSAGPGQAVTAGQVICTIAAG